MQKHSFWVDYYPHKVAGDDVVFHENNVTCPICLSMLGIAPNIEYSGQAHTPDGAALSQSENQG